MRNYKIIKIRIWQGSEDRDARKEEGTKTKPYNYKLKWWKTFKYIINNQLMAVIEHLLYVRLF